MGCDIHIYTEVKRKDTWNHADYFRRNRYYNEGNLSEPEFVVSSIYDGRNYRLFAVLANVRNYDNLNMAISPPKGLPENVCPYIKKKSDYWEGDGHSHSYFNLKELKDYQSNNNTVKENGLLTKVQVEELGQGILPNFWCRGSSDEDNMFWKEWTREVDVLGPLIKNMKEILEEEFYTYKEENDEDIRIVFWFDN